MKRLLTTTAIVAGALWFGPAAYAANCSTSDINLTIGNTTYTPAACASNIQTANSNPATETAALNTALGTSFSFLAKDDGTTATLDGIEFAVSTMTTNQAGTQGTWTITWTDVNGPLPDNLPITIDFDVLINGGNNADGYKFTGITLPIVPNTGTGNFAITFLNNGGNNPALSHLILTGGDDVQTKCTGTCDPAVPEPASLALLGVGLLGTAVFARRRTH